MYAFWTGRHTRKEAVAQRKGAAYSSTCLKSSGSVGSALSELESFCARFERDLDVVAGSLGGVLLNSTSS